VRRCARSGLISKNVQVNYWAEIDLAWELSDAIGSGIPHRDRGGVYRAIGAGDTYTAIVSLLEIAVSTGVSLSPDLSGKLAEWLDGYAYDDDTPRLRQLLDIAIATGR